MPPAQFAKDTVALILERAPQIQVLASRYAQSNTDRIVAAMYSCTRREVSRQATGDYNQALTPGSALAMSRVILSLSFQNVLWVGCGHGFEAITLALLSDRPLDITAIDRTPTCIESAMLLLRRVYMAVHGCEADEAADLDLNRPVKIGHCMIHFALTDAWTLSSNHGADFIYSAAEQETECGQSIAMFLQALAGGCALLAMYSSMWSKTGRHRAPRVAAVPRIRLEAGSRTLHIHDMRNYPMFRQPPGRVICSTHPPDGWLQAVPSSPLMHPGRRVAFYFDEDALWYPATVVVRQGCSALLRFDDERWPDLDAEDSMCFHLSVLASGSSDVHPPLPMTQPDQSGLYLSLSESGYQGVFRANTTGSKSLQGPNPWCARIRIGAKWRYLGAFPTARAAAVAYAAARVARSAQSVVPPPPSLVYQRQDRNARNWIAKVRISGVVKYVGTYGSRTEATEAYFAALTRQPSPARPDPSRPTHYRGIRLHLSSCRSGYLNVRPYTANRFRAVLQNPFQHLGSFPTAVKAAYAYAMAIRGRSSSSSPA